MLTHENVVASMSAVVLQFGDHRLRSDDVMLSFLPLAHMMERCCEVCYHIFLELKITLTNVYCSVQCICKVVL